MAKLLAMRAPLFLLNIALLLFGCTTSENPRRSPMPLRAISLAGAEFGTETNDFSCDNPGVEGKDYVWNSPETYAWFANQGVRLFRIPFRWERLQPRLGEPLDPTELGHLRQAVDHAKAHGATALLDLHNYGRYVFGGEGGPFTARLGDLNAKHILSEEDLVDFWLQISKEFQHETGIWGYGLMNEPHDLPSGAWKSASRAVVHALREASDNTLVFVGGDQWSKSESWLEVNGQHAWINDPASATIYEAHCYFDFDGSGTYRTSYTRELALDPNFLKRPTARLQPFIDWCQRNGVRGFIGELGVPGRDHRWGQVLREATRATDLAGMTACLWAAGDWWGEYPLSAQPDTNKGPDSPVWSWFRPAGP